MPFTDAIDDVSGGNTKTAQRDYRTTGVLPIVDQGQSTIAGYTDLTEATCRAELPVIVFGDHTRALKFVDFPFGMGADGVKVLKPKREWHPRFVYHYLRFVDIPSAGYSRHFKFLKELVIPRPPIDEQRRIVSILDQADALRTKRREALALLDDLTQSTFIDMFGLPEGRAVSPSAINGGSGFPWVLITDVARLATGHTPDRKKVQYWHGDVPWLALPDIRALDGRVARETLVNVTQAGVANSSAVILPADTICFSRTASIGFVTRLGRPMATSQDFHNWICGPALEPNFLLQALRISRPHLVALSDGSTHRTIYQRQAKQFKVMLPPLGDQKEFSQRCSSISKQLVTASVQLTLTEGLFQSLQARAFSGHL